VIEQLQRLTALEERALGGGLGSAAGSSSHGGHCGEGDRQHRLGRTPRPFILARAPPAAAGERAGGDRSETIAVGPLRVEC